MTPETKKKVFEALRRQRKSMTVPCDLCQKVVTKGYLPTHLKVTHGDGWSGRTQYEEASCDQCDKTFSSKQEWRFYLVAGLKLVLDTNSLLEELEYLVQV